MLKSVILPHEEEGFFWSISPFSGALIKGIESSGSSKDKIPDLVLSALKYCEEPFKCAWGHEYTIVTQKNDLTRRLQRYSNILTWLGNKNFLLSTVYGGLSAPLFSSTAEAYQYLGYVEAHSGQNTSDRCLPRSLLVAKTSTSFKNNGVLFIGAMLGSFDMHAWIIESGAQPDLSDRRWINYRPLLAYVSHE